MLCVMLCVIDAGLVGACWVMVSLDQTLWYIEIAFRLYRGKNHPRPWVIVRSPASTYCSCFPALLLACSPLLPLSLPPPLVCAASTVRCSSFAHMRSLNPSHVMRTGCR